MAGEEHFRDGIEHYVFSDAEAAQTLVSYGTAVITGVFRDQLECIETNNGEQMVGTACKITPFVNLALQKNTGPPLEDGTPAYEELSFTLVRNSVVEPGTPPETTTTMITVQTTGLQADRPDFKAIANSVEGVVSTKDDPHIELVFSDEGDDFTLDNEVQALNYILAESALRLEDWRALTPYHEPLLEETVSTSRSSEEPSLTFEDFLAEIGVGSDEVSGLNTKVSGHPELSAAERAASAESASYSRKNKLLTLLGGIALFRLGQSSDYLSNLSTWGVLTSIASGSLIVWDFMNSAMEKLDDQGWFEKD